jgi:hypothetical protein
MAIFMTTDPLVSGGDIPNLIISISRNFTPVITIAAVRFQFPAS